MAHQGSTGQSCGHSGFFLLFIASYAFGCSISDLVAELESLVAELYCLVAE